MMGLVPNERGHIEHEPNGLGALRVQNLMGMGHNKHGIYWQYSIIIVHGG